MEARAEAVLGNPSASAAVSLRLCLSIRPVLATRSQAGSISPRVRLRFRLRPCFLLRVLSARLPLRDPLNFGSFSRAYFSMFQAITRPQPDVSLGFDSQNHMLPSPPSGFREGVVWKKEVGGPYCGVGSSSHPQRCHCSGLHGRRLGIGNRKVLCACPPTAQHPPSRAMLRRGVVKQNGSARTGRCTWTSPAR